MYRTLYDYDSYQPIETKIDSAYYTPYNDTINQRYAIYCGVFYEKLDECYQQVDNAKRKMAIWSDLKDDSYGRQQYNAAYNEWKASVSVAKEVLSKVEDYYDSIRMHTNECAKEFIGWEVTHTFRCKTRGGYSDIITKVYLMDKQFTKILDLIIDIDDDYNKYQQFIKEALDGKTIKE